MPADLENVTHFATKVCFPNVKLLAVDLANALLVFGEYFLDESAHAGLVERKQRRLWHFEPIEVSIASVLRRDTVLWANDSGYNFEFVEVVVLRNFPIRWLETLGCDFVVVTLLFAEVVHHISDVPVASGHEFANHGFRYEDAATGRTEHEAQVEHLELVFPLSLLQANYFLEPPVDGSHAQGKSICATDDCVIQS